MSRPRLSVIVPVYNGERFIAEALDSALAQTWQDFEIIVVDDGSKDRSGLIADEYAKAHPKQIRVIHQPNQGLPLARNTAIEHSRGELLALLDSDDVWLPWHLEECVSELDHRPDLGLVHANFEFMDAEGRSLKIESGRWSPREPGDAWERIYLRKQHVGCPTAVFRRGVVDRVGMFDPEFNRLGCEDRDLWLRIAAVSELSYIDSVHARYRLHDSNMSSQWDKMKKARLKLAEKHGREGRGRGMRRRGFAAVYADDGAALRQSGRFGSALQAYGTALCYRPLSLAIWKGAVGALLARRPSGQAG